MRRKTPTSVCIVCIACLAFSAPAGEATDETGANGTSAIVDQVVRMLEAGVDEEVIDRWIAQRDVRVPLTADDLIALTRAEASRALIDRLMTAKPRAPQAIEPVRSDRAENDDRAQDEGARLDLSLRYRPARDVESDDDDRWHLFVYLDGRPIGGSSGHNWLSKAKRTHERSLRVAPGLHMVRLLQERHTHRGRRWRHEARVCEERIHFESGVEPVRIEIDLREPVGLAFGARSSKTWTLTIGDSPRSEGTLATSPDEWLPLCEEVEANHADRKKLPRAARKQLDRCLRWDLVWQDVAPVPDRDTIRSRLEAMDFRPDLLPSSNGPHRESTAP